MIKHFIFLLLFLMLLVRNVQAQEIKEVSKYSWVEKNFFHEISWSGVIIGEIVFAQSDMSLSFISMCYEPRINILNIRDFFSISLNTPINFSPSIYVDGSGAFHLNSGFVPTFNFLYHSTFNNIDFKGFSIGAGVQYVIGPIIKGEYYNKSSNDLQAVTKIEYKWESKTTKRDTKGRSLSFTFGIGKYAYYKFSYGFILGY